MPVVRLWTPHGYAWRQKFSTLFRPRKMQTELSIPLSQQESREARSLGQHVVVFCLLFYKTTLSPVMPSCCKFYPTCSMYAKEAVERHGAIKGSWLAAKRLLRCRPFAHGGFDPVPDA